MEDHLRLAVAHWHFFGCDGGDLFGGLALDAAAAPIAAPLPVTVRA
ncbi:MAG: hypothetical protein ACK4GT_13795 [Pararhodobacter sp.]